MNQMHRGLATGLHKKEEDEKNRGNRLANGKRGGKSVT